MFRVARELSLRDKGQDFLWLAWADYLILASVAMAIFGAIIPLLTSPKAAPIFVALAASSCVAALILQAGYIPSILAHYRIEVGRDRLRAKVPSQKGEPIEKVVVITTAALAIGFFIFTLILRLDQKQ